MFKFLTFCYNYHSYNIFIKKGIQPFEIECPNFIVILILKDYFLFILF